MAFSTDGSKFALGTSQTLEICDANTGKAISTIETISNDVAWSADGSMIATCDGALAREVKIWDSVSLTLRHTLKVPNRENTSSSGIPGAGRLCFSPNSKLIAFGDGNGTTTIWDTSVGAEVHQLVSNYDGVNTVSFSADGERIAVGGNDRLVRIWNLTTGRVIYTLRGHEGDIRGAAFAPDGRHLATLDGWECRIWEGE